MLHSIATIDTRYKDAHPLDTVSRIKGILSQHGIATEERWYESDVPYCYSLRVAIAGTSFGANGKGVTKEFALASGYGELIERLQLGHIWRDKVYIDKGATSADSQSELVSVDSLLKKNLKWYTACAEELRKLTGVSMTAQQLLGQYADGSGNVRATPFYCASTGETEYLPTTMVKAVYGTNGGAAGNTLEESIVQALSEIVERRHKLRVIFENIPVPNIPEEVLKTFPIAWEIISFLRDSGYRVMIKDCSLGTRFPVVCVCIIQEETGKYHTHFGAHPNLEVALQRTLTETFQGRNVKRIAQYDDFCSKVEESYGLRHLMTELTKGSSKKMPQLFYLEPEQPYRATSGFNAGSNRECLRECIEFFREQGYDVLIRDCSCLGFPTCQVVVPGYSEALPQRLSAKFNDMRYSAYANKTLRHPAAATPMDLAGLMMHISESKKYKITGLGSFLAEAGIPAVLPKSEEAYLMDVTLAHVNYTMGKPGEVIRCINSLLQNPKPENDGYLICLKRYLSMVQNGDAPEEIKTVLTFFHKPEQVQRLYACLEKKKNPFDELVLRCDEKCSPDCRLYDSCKKTYTDSLLRLILDKSKQKSQSELRSLLQTI